METIEDVFHCWNTLTEMAADLGEKRSKVEKWKERGRIPSNAWLSLIQALERKGKDLSSDELLAMHAQQRIAPVTPSHPSP